MNGDIEIQNTKISTPKTKRIEKASRESNSQKKQKHSSKKKEKPESKMEDKSTVEKNKLTSSEHIEPMDEDENKGGQVEL